MDIHPIINFELPMGLSVLELCRGMRHTDGRTDGRTDRQTDGRTPEPIL